MHKADLHIELPEGVDANVLVLMYDTEKLSEKTASEMKMKVGAAITVSRPLRSLPQFRHERAVIVLERIAILSKENSEKTTHR